MGQIEDWKALAQQLRVDSIRCSTAAGSGHPSSALSAADLVAVLASKYLRYDFGAPGTVANDHLILSKGHASPLLYATLKAAGAITDDELMRFRRAGARVQGHPTPHLPWVNVATGSLGQGLPIGVGIALAGRYVDKAPYVVWVIHGDSEMAEGSVWEAFDKAGYYKLGNLVTVLDMNRLGQRGQTALGWDGEAYAARARGFGWHAIQIDGHDLTAIDQAYSQALQIDDRPVLIVAKTMKGRGVSQLQDREDWHGKTLTPEQASAAIAELGGEKPVRVKVATRAALPAAAQVTAAPVALPHYAPGDKLATRQAYGEALRALGRVRSDVVVLDADVGNSTFADLFGKENPDRYFEMFISEQQMVGSAVGFSVRGYVPFAATFGAFLTRAYDFIRMAAVSEASIHLCGSHAGVSIGEDGPSQMGLEDLAMMRAVHGSVVLYPCDANQAAQLTQAMADQPGISYIRTTREKTPVLYPPDEVFRIGGSRVLRAGPDDAVSVVAAGITVHEALEAARRLDGLGIKTRVIDLYSVKPVDAAAVLEALQATQGRLVVVEDHWPEGGVADAVLEAVAASRRLSVPIALEHLAVREMPSSGTPSENLAAAGIDAAGIVDAVKRLVAAV